MSKTVVSKDNDGKEVTIIVKKPTPQNYNRANLAAQAAFAKLVKEVDADGKPVYLLRSQVQDMVRERKLWDDAREKEFQEIGKKIASDRRTLLKGGMKLSEGRSLAIRIRDNMFRMRELEQLRNSFDNLCLESKVEAERLNNLVVQCVFYDDGTPVFKSVDDYLNSPIHPWTNDVARAVTEVIFGVNVDDVDKTLPENKFLLQHKFADDKGHFVRRQDGRLVDVDGRLIDETGRYVNEAGQFIDIDGNLVDSEGFPLVENPEPFLDDDGQPVL